jgi:2-polyprenyl-6-hydroxyphenyl methylase/3-demethylubiquinone-9 3-methyltransferase
METRQELRAAAPSASVDPAEVERFDRLAARWWDDQGPLAPLHRLNPARLKFIRDRSARHFRRDPLRARPLEGLRALDIGCGGGLIAEPMARLGARVSAIDAAPDAIDVARGHARAAELSIDYRHATAEELAEVKESYDLVLALEVVEHVADLEAFLAAVARLVKPGGLLILATINRTPMAFAQAIVAAEYVLGWLPRGTHQWSRFVRPSELARALRPHGIAITAFTGLSYRVLRDDWVETPDLDVNYMACAARDP